MISAVAQKYNIHPQTLRLYEREGLLKPSRTEGNTRLYSEEDLEQLETILSLTRDLGVNLAGVEIILNMRRKIEADAARGQRVHGLREARAVARPRRLGAAPQHRARQVVADRSRARVRRPRTRRPEPRRRARRRRKLRGRTMDVRRCRRDDAVPRTLRASFMHVHRASQSRRMHESPCERTTRCRRTSARLRSCRG